MNLKLSPIAVGFLIFLLALFLLRVGIQDKQDPEWNQIGRELQQGYQTLEDAPKELKTLYDDFHLLEEPSPDSFAFQILADPFLPTIEFEKFHSYVEQMRSERFVLISGVSGVGTSTITNRLARFIASKPENLLEILCAPHFDLELHKQYIGERRDHVFHKGTLLQFFDRCEADSTENFVVLIDNLDKINPETFFGPKLWRKLDNPSYDLRFEGLPVHIPDNFYLICVTHAGASSKIELSNEHFRRLGEPQYLAPERKELILYLRQHLTKLERELANTPNPKEKAGLVQHIKALQDTLNVKKFVYAFSKINSYIEQRYSKDHRLGQWSNLRNLYQEEDRERLFAAFLTHVNALKPAETMRDQDLDPIRYSLETEGLLKGTNFFSSQFRALREEGFLTEFAVGLTFLLVSGLFSWYFFRKRQRFILDYTDQVHQLFSQFENNQLSYDDVSAAFSQIKKEVDELIMQKKLNYSEASFFYTFIENRVKQIELGKEVNRNFRQLVDTFMEDQVLTDGEYKKLKNYLLLIKNKISLEDYDKFAREIESLKNTFGRKKEP